jgi:hypothetical protein
VLSLLAVAINWLSGEKATAVTCHECPDWRTIRSLDVCAASDTLERNKTRDPRKSVIVSAPSKRRGRASAQF